MSIFSKFCPTSLCSVYVLIIMSTFSRLCPLFYISSKCLPCRNEQKKLETNTGCFYFYWCCKWLVQKPLCFLWCLRRRFMSSLQTSIIFGWYFFEGSLQRYTLAATVYNGNNGLFLLDFCVCNIEDAGNRDCFLRSFRQILYEDVVEPYSPTHQLLFISDSEKKIL